MNNKYVIYIATIITIASIASAAFMYVNYSAQTANLKSQNSNLTLVDDEGYVTNLTSVPQRIISLAPSCTQILFAIGVGDKVVGVTTYDDYPYNFSAWIAAGNMTSIGGYSTPDMEAIAMLHPNLIVSDNINDAIFPNMRSLGYKVLVINPNSINGIYQDISLIGRATGAEPQAIALIDNISSSINVITAKIAATNITVPLKVYYEIWSDPLMSAGSTSWVSDVIAKAGGVNIFANVAQQYPAVSSETVVQLNPDVILLPTSPGGSGGMAFYGSIAQVEARPGWNSMSAVQNNRVDAIDEELFAEPGPRVADQVLAVATCLYPQLFNSTA
ncbi:MAG: cobalamin-binding protein [Candidatus Bathyarchaeia archaeon]|jgi:iron complex transport system substrate-binding protein